MTARTGIARTIRITVITVACLAACVAPAAVVAASAGAVKAPASHYYLALGDWLATGIGASSSATELREPGGRARGSPIFKPAVRQPGVWGRDDQPPWPTARGVRIRPAPSWATQLPFLRAHPAPGGVRNDRHRGR